MEKGCGSTIWHTFKSKSEVRGTPERVRRDDPTNPWVELSRKTCSNAPVRRNTRPFPNLVRSLEDLGDDYGTCFLPICRYASISGQLREGFAIIDRALRSWIKRWKARQIARASTSRGPAPRAHGSITVMIGDASLV